MTLMEVNNSISKDCFHQVPHHIYNGDKEWVCPLQMDIEGVFDKSKNPAMMETKAKRWVLNDQNGNPLGRAAAFIDYKKIREKGMNAGGMGFFECINDQNAANILFGKCEEWLQSKEMEGMEGPVTIGGNHNYWGLLAEGFENPSYGVNYNPPYYQQLFENYGFKPQYEQYTNTLEISQRVMERFSRISERAQKDGSVTAEHYNKAFAEKYIDDFVTIYNRAWTFHKDFMPMQKEYIRESLQQLKPILEERLIWFIYINKEPAGFIVTIPDLNKLIFDFEGKLSLWKGLKLIYRKHRKYINRIRILIMGIVPEYQKRGLESVLISKLSEQVDHFPHLKEAELSWTGSFNPGMLAIHKASGAKPKHTHITYYKEF